MIEIENKKYYTTRELAKMFGKKEATIRVWLIKYSIHYKHIGKYNYIEEAELKKLFSDGKNAK
ncbi:MAG: hypothetical protein KGY74_09425 [Candidatus Cloacimonetes bacterium]|nr:hypothetical protein [Candidatus Cloacimonadota bacterium]